MTEQRRSYAGECVYVGVDVHKETYTVTCVCHKQIVKTATVQAEPASLVASLQRWFPGATLASAPRPGFLPSYCIGHSPKRGSATSSSIPPLSLLQHTINSRRIAATPRDWPLTWRTVACE